MSTVPPPVPGGGRLAVWIVVPVAVVLAIVTGGLAWTLCKPAQAGGGVVDGLWFVAPAVLFFLDLVAPVVGRIAFSYFVCRDLHTGPGGDSGWWLEPVMMLRLYQL